MHSEREGGKLQPRLMIGNTFKGEMQKTTKTKKRKESADCKLISWV